MAATYNETELVQYNARHKVVICRECKYAIQKSALSSHLLRHKIYRGARQRLLDSIQHLDILEPDDVALPPAGSPPIDGLLVISGYRCTHDGCAVLCASFKRMRRHGSEVHGVPDPPTSSAQPAQLQTFFRGTKLRYFEVATAGSPDSARTVGDGVPGTEDQSMVDAVSSHGLDMETLRYFHHFISATSFTLPASVESRNHWQCDAVARALQQPWLMCGLLALSASHMSTVSQEHVLKAVHGTRAQRFLQDFTVGWRVSRQGEQDTVAAEAELAVQIVCIHRCYLWMVEPRAPDIILDLDQPPFEPKTFTETLRGCCDPRYAIEVARGDIDVTGGPIRESTNDVRLGPTTPSGCPGVVPPTVLEHFRTLPYRMANVVGKPNNALDFFATMSALGAVEECCSLSYAANDTAGTWHGMISWLTRISDRFSAMVWSGSPAALVVFAQWTSLIERTERHCWFLTGAAAKLRGEIEAKLSADDTMTSLLRSYVLE
jgi:hypothetical protein